MKRGFFIVFTLAGVFTIFLSGCIDESGHYPDISGEWHGTIASGIDSVDRGTWVMNITRFRRSTIFSKGNSSYSGSYMATGTWGSTGALKMNVAFDGENVTLTYSTGSQNASMNGEYNGHFSGTFVQSANIIGLGPKALSGTWEGTRP